MSLVTIAGSLNVWECRMTWCPCSCYRLYAAAVLWKCRLREVQTLVIGILQKKVISWALNFRTTLIGCSGSHRNVPRLILGYIKLNFDENDLNVNASTPLMPMSMLSPATAYEVPLPLIMIFFTTHTSLLGTTKSYSVLAADIRICLHCRWCTKFRTPPCRQQ